MFDANGTEGLELFTWIVAALLGLVAALMITHVLTVSWEEHGAEDLEEAEEKHHDHHQQTTV